MTKPAKQFLADLEKEVLTHPAVNHLFLNRLATSPFSKEDYRVFAEIHYPLVCIFTSYLERLLLTAPDSESKTWLAKVLVDEYGEGSDGHDHATLYGDFLRATGGDPDVCRSRQIPAPSFEFIITHRKMIAQKPFLEGLGAVGPGHEWAIPNMFAAIIPGLRRAGFSEKEIGYFTLHIEQDEDHGTWLGEALERYAYTQEAQTQIRNGAIASMNARQRFWDGVQHAVMRYRQPRAVRPDGKRPRRLFQELALTSWDGLPFSRWVEARMERSKQRGIPTLSGLLGPAEVPIY